MKRTFIIAEAGVNHNGELNLAYQLINEAIEAGADAIKFQTYKTDKLVTRSAKKAEYQKKSEWVNQTQFQMLKQLELSYGEFEELFEYCKDKKIQFISSPFDIESVDLLDRLGVSLFKIGSGEITNKKLLQHIASKNKPVILSTGMSTLDEVIIAIQWILERAHVSITLLHCNSDYPSKYEDINLQAMQTIKDATKLKVGYSDHSKGIEIPIAAVAMGAEVIEKHFTLDKKMDGPDHSSSLNPKELSAMVSAIRNVEMAIGNGSKSPSASELKNRESVRKSLIVNKDIIAGTKLSEELIEIKRPGKGIAPQNIDYVIGMHVTKDVSKDTCLQWSDFK